MELGAGNREHEMAAGVGICLEIQWAYTLHKQIQLQLAITVVEINIGILI